MCVPYINRYSIPDQYIMTKEEYVLLYEKCRSGNCTEQEKKQLEEYQDDFSLENVHWNADELGDEQLVTSDIYQKLKESIRTQHVKKLQWYKLPLAAAIGITVLSLGLYLYWSRAEQVVKPAQIAVSPIIPGGNKAILTLEDGSRVVLDNSDNGVLANQGPAVISKEKNGKLVYNTVAVAANQPMKYNSIVIPRGGQYQLVLPDGTKVWLNAASSLRFPVAFTGKDRKVELSGEAYFEVAKNKEKPFHVIANGTEVEVLGTHFNVNSYTKEVNTTLVEGAVKLKATGNEVILKPGQSGITTENKGFDVKMADMESTLAWKNGLFIFHDENLHSIMEKVSRWYDVEIEYRGNVQHKQLYGKVSRYEQVKELLNNMELTGIVHFKIEGRRIIVMP